MIYGDSLIREMIERGLIVGAEDRQVNPASLNLRLDGSYSTPKAGQLVTLGEPVLYREFHDDSYLLRPGEFILASTMEEVTLLDDMAAFVHGRSSIGRAGLTVQNAGYVDPGFTGHITLELKNEGYHCIQLPKGYPVAQLVFMDASGVVEPYHGKYNGQVTATGSRMHLDKEDGTV